jgi:hypothetical protein
MRFTLFIITYFQIRLYFLQQMKMLSTMQIIGIRSI